MPISCNYIGDQGESIFTTRISKGGTFKVYFLGEKAPIVDFLIETVEQNSSYYFLVQVKGTEQGYLKCGNLNARVDNEKMKELLKRLLPTYVAGVDIKKEIVYLCPAFTPETKYHSILTKHKLELADKQASDATIKLLKQDVVKFWQNSEVSKYKSIYQSLL